MVEGPVELSRSYRPPPAGARRIGDARLTDEVEVTITLRGPQMPDASSVTGQATDLETFEARYSADAADAAKVRDELEKLGLQVYDVSLVTRSMHVRGTVQQLNDAFQVTLGTYQSDDQGQFRGREGCISVPAPLAGIVTGVFGLDDRQMAQRKNAPVQAATAARSPADLEALYQFPPGDAAGQDIVIAEFGGTYSASDVKTFCQEYNPAMPAITLLTLGQGADQVLPDYTGELMMDVEIIAALCPAASISVYFVRFNEKGWIDLLDAVVKTEPLPPVALSVSYGRAEDSPDWSGSAVTEINQRLQSVAMLGVTVCAASGDDGAGDQLNDGRAHVNFPASSPFVLSVGGTMLTGTPPAEVVWWAAPGDKSQGGAGGSTGGGVSTIFPRPAWQTVTVESLNAGSMDGRVVPDVAALAGQPYYRLIIGGEDSQGGGTSAAAPLWAALLARISAGLPDPSQRRFLAPLLYGAAPDGRPVGATVCTDITSGDNHSPGVPQGYLAGVGYDAVSGWGTPLGTPIAQLLSQPGGNGAPGALPGRQHGGHLGQACFAVDQADDGRVAAQPVQGAAAVRADAPDRDAEPGADLGVGHGWIGDEQSQQPLGGQRQAGERLAQRGLALRLEQLVLNRLGLLILPILQYLHVTEDRALNATDPAAFPPGRGGYPARERGRITQAVQALHQVQPDVLGNVLGGGAADPVPAADGPDQRGVSLDEGVPRPPIAVSGPGHQVADHRVVARRAGLPVVTATRCVQHFGHRLPVVAGRREGDRY
jgi:kumamolisin